MPDREKVIKGLECCSDIGGFCEECPYGKDCRHLLECIAALSKDALALLKEQKAVAPKTTSSDYDTDTWWFVCGSCKKGVISPGDKFCRECGRPVKWE